MNRVLDALDAVNTQSTFKDPLDMSGNETYNKSMKSLNIMLNSIPDEMATASIPSTKDDDKDREETSDIIQIGPRQFEVYIDPREELDDKASGIDDWTMTSSWLDAEISYAAEDNECKKSTCEEVQDYFLEQSQTCLNQELIERLKREGIKVLRVDNE